MRRRHAVYLGGALLAALACVLVGVERSQYWSLVRAAQKEYRSSRVGDPQRSVSFRSRGVKLGMTEDSVDALMSDARKTIRRMPSVSPPWDGFVNIYEFHYGPDHTDFISHKKAPLIREVFTVYFAQDGSARKMRRMLFQRGQGGVNESFDPLPK